MMGIFTLQAFRNGERVDDDQRPRLIIRPNPFSTLRDYLRETGWSMATRGESWQWIAARDVDRQPLSVIPVPSREIEVSGDWLSPVVKWRRTVKALRDKWTETPPNMPQVTSGPITAEALQHDGSQAQMLDARNWNAGEASRSYQIPGPLLEYSRGGSSLSYSNVVTLMDQLLKQCLIPNYLEPVEQMLTDLLPRSWVTRFNVDAILRADIKTRFEVYESGLRSGVYPDVTIPQQAEGIIAGSVETAPVPYSPPSALPGGIPARTFSVEPWRCDSCGKMLAEQRGQGTRMKCPRCSKEAIA
jgi:hypothetical protein